MQVDIRKDKDTTSQEFTQAVIASTPSSNSKKTPKTEKERVVVTPSALVTFGD